MTPEAVVKKIFRLEKNHNLFEMKVNNIAFYQLIRMQLYYYIVEEKKIFNKQDYSYKNISLTIYYIIKEVFSWYKRQKLINNKICIIQHSREIDRKDIYTDYLKKIIKEYSILHHSAGQNYTFQTNSINYDYFSLLKKILSLLGFSKPNQNKSVNKFIKIFKHEFLLDDKFENTMYSYIQNQINAYKVAKQFLKKTKFKTIIVVNSYSNQAILYAANELNIDTIELQHGVINKNHLGYHFPKLKKNQLLSFPRKLVLFGDFWKDKANYPINNKQLISLGSPHFDENYSKVKKIDKRNKNRVLVLSQQTMQRYLLDFIKSMVLNQKNLKFTYKAHPKENIKFAQNFLKNNKLMKNVKIIHGKQNIYKLFQKHTMQIGVFSTALYEGYSCKLKTGILVIPGWESMKTILHYPNIYTIKNYSDFKKMLISSNKNFSSAFFKPNAKKNFEEFFKQYRHF